MNGNERFIGAEVGMIHATETSRAHGWSEPTQSA